MKRKKTGVVLAMGVICLISLAGCSKKTKGQDGTGQPETGEKNITFEAEDFIPGSDTYRATDTGHYYYSTKLQAIRYVDFSTGKDMYLCNKPECRHDGNAFCVATNGSYVPRSFCIYGGMLFATVVEETDTQYLYKLLSIGLDGSEMNEVVTYYTAEKNGVSLSMKGIDSPLYIHRNKVWLPLAIAAQDGGEDVAYYGTAIYDLNTKELKHLDEELLSKENVETTSVTPYGDYFYYCKKEGKKTVLHRYNITNGADETFPLLASFKGEYVVLGDRIFYARGQGKVLCIHHIATGENEERALTRKNRVLLPDGTSKEDETTYTITELRTDGTYLYIPEVTREYSYTWEEGEVTQWQESYLNVFDTNGNPVCAVNLLEQMGGSQPEGVEKPVYGEPTRLRFLGETVYCRMDTEDRVYYMFRCKRSDLFLGKPEFELVYKVEELVDFGTR